MGRSESKQAFNDSQAAQQQMEAQARQALDSTNSAMGDYKNKLNDFMNFGRRMYTPGGEYDRENTLLGTSVSSGGAESTADQLNDYDKRTGNMNAAQMGAAAEEVARGNRRGLTDFLAGAAQDRMNKQTALEQYGVQASALPADVYGRIYGTATGGRDSALGTETDAAKMPGFWDTFLPALVQGAGSAASGFFIGAAPKPPNCWIAEAIYGTDDPRTHLVREWLNVEFALRPLGRYVMKAYLRFGEKLAAWLRKSGMSRALFRLVFDRALSDAIHWKVSQSGSTSRAKNVFISISRG